MEPSPRGRQIRKISGNGGDIRDRGTEMESLGMQMRESAGILKAIKDGAEGKGYSIDKIKDNVGDLHVDLRKAGERYEPSGKVLREYGAAVVEVKSTLNGIVDECAELWRTYEKAMHSLETANDAPIPDDETPAQTQTRESGLTDLGTSKTAAYNAWHTEATKYDAPYDTWDTAYDNAVSGLLEANDDGVEDGWWDDALPFIEAALIVLAVAGVILAVLAIVIAGPIVALLAAIVGLITLGLTIWKVLAGRGGIKDIGMAVIGIIPFGRFGQLAGVFKGQSGFAAFARGFGGDMVGLTQFRELRALRGLPGLVEATPVMNRAGNLTQSQNIIDSMHQFGRNLGELPYRTPAGWLSRIQGGGSGQLADGITNLYGSQSPSNIARMNNLLSGTALDGMQNGRSGLDTVGNIIDSVVKPISDTDDLAGDLSDLFSTDSAQWEQQLSASK